MAHPHDVNDSPRRLLVLDVEGTLFKTEVVLPGTSLSSTIWQAIALELGPEAVREEVDTHGRWKRGEYDSYLDWMLDTIEIHQRHELTEATFRSIVDGAMYNAGVREALNDVHRDRFVPVLVSGGFRALAERAQKDFQIRHSFAACDYIFDSAGRIAGFNLLPCDFEGKLDFIQLMLREYRLDDSAWVFIGDGANDVPIAKQAPVSIGYRPHAELASVVTATMDAFDDLADLLSSFS